MRILISTFLLLAFIASSCTSPQFEKDMVYLDQRFIPVLYHAYHQNMEQTEIAMHDFEVEWNEFNGLYQDRYQDAYWQVSFELVSNWLAEAKYFLNKKDAINTFATLQQISYQLNDARSTHQIEYWLDEVWNLERSLEFTMEVATDAMLCQNEQDLLNELKGEVDYNWQTLQTVDIDVHLFELDNNEISDLINQEKRFTEALVVMDDAIDKKDCGQITIAAQQLKYAYFEYLSVFGEFRTISEPIALQ